MGDSIWEYWDKEDEWYKGEITRVWEDELTGKLKYAVHYSDMLGNIFHIIFTQKKEDESDCEEIFEENDPSSVYIRDPYYQELKAMFGRSRRESKHFQLKLLH